MNKRTQQLFLMLVIGVLIGTSTMLAWQTRGVGSAGDAQGSTPSGATSSVLTLPATTTDSLSRVPNLPAAREIPANLRVGISASDQPAGSAVFVTGLSINESHWVAVYEDREGQPGNILGAARVFPGYISTSVDLLRNTEAGKTYYVAILNDNGDEVFDRLTDLPPFSPDRVVIISFRTR